MEAVLTGQTAVCDDPDRIRQELDRVQQKKDAVMDAYFSCEISKEDMLSFKEKYEQQLSGLLSRLNETEIRKENKQDSAAMRALIKAELAAILTGETDSEVFYKNILESLTVFKDRHMELRLNYLPQAFQFAE